MRVALVLGVAIDGAAANAQSGKLQWLAFGAAALLLVGVWTPVVGVLLAVVELALAVSGPERAECRVLLSALAACVAMVGPGGWSMDARLFGRKRVDLRGR